MIKSSESWIKESTFGKILLDSGGVSNLIFLIEIVKSAWEQGQAKNSDFNKLLALSKIRPWLHIFMHILGCFRLSKQFEMPETSYKPLSEYLTLILSQGASLCDLPVLSTVLALGETYYCTRGGDKVYLIEEMKKNRIFSLREFWESYLMWSAIRGAKDSSHFAKSNIDMSALKKSAMDTISSVFLTVSYEMLQAGIDKTTCREIVSAGMDRFKLDEESKSQTISFINSHKK